MLAQHVAFQSSWWSIRVQGFYGQINGADQGWGCRQVKGIVWENHAKKLLLQVHVLYEDLTDDPN